tara:strand:- start:368 stop:1354 length:987 start_codon:yes stop_codon:yes gene_type:complete
MKTRVVITVDTEPSIAGAYEDPGRNLPLIHEPVWGEVDGRSEALGFLIRTLRQHSLAATFFTETAHVRYFGADLMGAYARSLKEAGQDVQLHIHPTWTNFENGELKHRHAYGDDCHLMETGDLARLIAEGCDLIEGWTGDRPTSMRTGNFSTAMNVFEAMSAAGLKTSSNLCIAANRPEEIPLQIAGGVKRYAGILEYPVTCFSDSGPVGRGRRRPLQVTSISAAEQISTLENVHAMGGSVAVILTHPFEFLKREQVRFTRMRPNRLVQRRFERLCAYLAANSDRFDVVPMSKIGDELTTEEALPDIAGSTLNSLMRSAENFLNDKIF